MGRSTKGYIPRNNVSIEEIIKVLNSDGGTLKADNLDIREIFDQLETRKGNLYGKFVNGDGKPNTAPATRDIATDYTSIDPQVPGTTPEDLLHQLNGTGSYDLGDLRGYGGAEELSSDEELPEIYWKELLDYNGYNQAINYTEGDNISSEKKKFIPAIALAPPFSEKDVSGYIAEGNYITPQQSILFTPNKELDKYFRLNTKVGIDYYNHIPSSSPKFNIKVTPILGLSTKYFDEEFIFTLAGKSPLPQIIVGGFGGAIYLDYWLGPNSGWGLSFSQLGLAVANITVALAAIVILVSIADAIWDAKKANEVNILQAPYQYRNLVGNLYNFLDIYESTYKFGFGNKNFGYDIESPTGANVSSFIKQITELGETFQYTLNDFNYSGIDYSESNPLYEFPTDSSVRGKYLNMTFNPKGVQYDLQTPPPIISYLVELEAVQNCKLSTTKPTKFMVSAAPYDHKYPKFDVVSSAGEGRYARDFFIDRFVSDTFIDLIDWDTIPSGTKYLRAGLNTPITLVNGKWCDFIGMIASKPDGGRFTIYRHMAINTDSQYERKKTYFGNNRYIKPIQNNLVARAGYMLTPLTLEGTTAYTDEATIFNVFFYNEDKPQIIRNYNFRAYTDTPEDSCIRLYWNASPDWDISSGAAINNGSLPGNYLEQILNYSYGETYKDLITPLTNYFLEIDISIISGSVTFITRILDNYYWNTNVWAWSRTSNTDWPSGDSYYTEKDRSALDQMSYYNDGELPDGIIYSYSGDERNGITFTSSGTHRIIIRSISKENALDTKRVLFKGNSFNGKINSIKLNAIGKGSITDSASRGSYAISSIDNTQQKYAIHYDKDAYYGESHIDFNVKSRYAPLSFTLTMPDTFNYSANNIFQGPVTIVPKDARVNIEWGYTQDLSSVVTSDYSVVADEIITITDSPDTTKYLIESRPSSGSYTPSIRLITDYIDLASQSEWQIVKFVCNDPNLTFISDKYGKLMGGDVDLSNSGVNYRFEYLSFNINSLNISNTSSRDNVLNLALNSSIESEIDISNTQINGTLDHIINIPIVNCVNCGIYTYNANTKPVGGFTYHITWKNCYKIEFPTAVNPGSFTDEGISENSLTRLLIDLDLSGATDGYLDIAGDNPEITNTYALEAIDSLISKGWNVLYNAITIPVITLVGDSPLTWTLGETFVDPGATAYDERDGDITESIVVTDNIDVNTEGTYQVTYNVTDSDGNAAEEVVRTVVVEAALAEIWGTEIVEVTNPITGRTWMDRNIGATRAATSSTDSEAYGHLFQWGRNPDGHELRTSGTTSTLSSTDVPGHGDFITAGTISLYDWRSPQNDNLWQDIIQDGWRLPTRQEWLDEIATWGSKNSSGAYNSVLKLPVAGSRSSGNGTLNNMGSDGLYWSSTVNGTSARRLGFGNSANVNYHFRANGFSVRLIRD